MMQLTEELTTTENKVAFARQAFNDSVMTYNNKLKVFPNNIIAGMFKFDEGVYFEVEGVEPAKATITDEKKQAVDDISFDDL